MKSNSSLGMMLTFLVTILLALAFNIQPVKSEHKTWTVDDDGPADFNIIRETMNTATSALAGSEVTFNDWSMFRHDSRHTGYSTSKAPNANSTLWNYTTQGFVFSSPSVVDGLVFVGSGLWDNKVYALNETTGEQVWNYTTDSFVYSSPAVADGRVFVGSYDHRVYALNGKTGELIWNYATGDTVHSSPTVFDDRVYVGSFDGYVYALNSITGALIWSYNTGAEIWSSPAVANGMVFIGNVYRYRVYALNVNTGELIWSYLTGAPVYSSPAVDNGKVFIASYMGDVNVFALNQTTGALIWASKAGNYVTSSPAVAYSKVYIGSDDGKVYAFDEETGEFVWSYTTGDWVRSSPAVADGKVFVGSRDGKVYALNAFTGEHVWSYQTGYEVFSSPAVANGRLFIGSSDGNVYSFGPAFIEVPKDYATIQEAINAANPGDTVFVRAATYQENVVVNRTVLLIGENSILTIIDGGGVKNVVEIAANNVVVQGFTIRNSGAYNHGIHIENYNNTIIRNNVITNNRRGIWLAYSSNNTVYENNITANSGFGVHLYSFSNNNTIFGNHIINNWDGIWLVLSSKNTISGNSIANNTYGIGLSQSSNNSIYHNNFINNTKQAYLYPPPGYANVWDDGYPSGGNYWSDYSTRYPTVKDEYQGASQDVRGSDGIWDSPYEIDVDNRDRYPLVEPWAPKPSTPIEALEELIETIEDWDLPKGTENSLTSKLEDTLHLLDKGNENGALHKLMDFINQVEALRGKKLPNDKANYLVSEAQRIIDLING